MKDRLEDLSTAQSGVGLLFKIGFGQRSACKNEVALIVALALFARGARDLLTTCLSIVDTSKEFAASSKCGLVYISSTSTYGTQ
jgi:hypothetical protein